MPNLRASALTLAIDPEPVLADMIAKVDALQDYMLVPIALAGADLTLRAVKVARAESCAHFRPARARIARPMLRPGTLNRHPSAAPLARGVVSLEHPFLEKPFSPGRDADPFEPNRAPPALHFRMAPPVN